MRVIHRPRLSRRAKTIGVAGLALMLAIALAHQMLLQTAGSWLVHSDPVHQTEYAILTPETDRAGELEATALFEEKLITRVAILEPAEDRIDREFRRRGVVLPNLRVERLLLLGIPRDRLTLITAGEGDTRDSTSAVANWFRQNPTADAVIITGVTHSRRFRRVLSRKWQAERPLPPVHATRFDDFRPRDWWKRRWTLRGGIVELQKLALDFLAHPF
jgi:hypothetical protein